jgi:hypothetical protein
MGDGRIFIKKKASVTLPFIKIYRMSLLSAGSIPLDSTFNDYAVRGPDTWPYGAYCRLFSLF